MTTQGISSRRAHSSAVAAAKEMLEQGALPHPSTAAFATVHGRNVNRDIRRGLKRGRKLTGMDLEALAVKVTMRKSRSTGTEQETQYVILPHELLHHMHKCGGKAWEDGMAVGGIEQFWRHERGLPWCALHPALQRPDLLQFTIPFGMHGDEVVDQKSGKVLVLQWNSVLSRAPSMKSRWVFTIIDHRRMHGRVTLWELMVIFVWSMNVAAVGVFPNTDYLGKPWPAKSWRSTMSGQPIAGQYRLAFSEIRGDEEFMAWLFAWNSYRHDWCCHRCMASKVVPDFSFTDFRMEKAVWAETMVSHTDFCRNHARRPTPVLSLHGFHISRAMRDPMHGVNLGVAQHVAGNVVYEMCKRKCGQVNHMNDWLENFWHKHKAWCRIHGLGSTIGQFSVANLNKAKLSQYPLLHAKAANTKYLISHLAEVTLAESIEDPTNEHLRAVASVVYNLAEFFWCMENSDRYMSDAARDSLYLAGTSALLIYSSLAQEGAATEPGRSWHIVPKMHYMCHPLMDAYDSKWNPAYHACWADEDFVGKMARSTARLHRSTLSREQSERYLNMLHVVWNDDGVEVDMREAISKLRTSKAART